MEILLNDLKWAAAQGLISDTQAEALWQALDSRHPARPKFDLTHVVYYFGAMLISRR